MSFRKPFRHTDPGAKRGKNKRKAYKERYTSPETPYVRKCKYAKDTFPVCVHVCVSVCVCALVSGCVCETFSYEQL